MAHHGNTFSRFSATGAFSLIDTVGRKRFTDSAIPAGTRTIVYTIEARRGDRASPWSHAIHGVVREPERGGPAAERASAALAA